MASPVSDMRENPLSCHSSVVLYGAFVEALDICEPETVAIKLSRYFPSNPVVTSRIDAPPAEQQSQASDALHVPFRIKQAWHRIVARQEPRSNL